ALVLQLMAETGKSISELVADIGGYYVEKTKFKADSMVAAKIIELAKEKFSNAQINTLDGCRFDFDDGWVHLRSSNTEPVMRLIVETKERGDAVKYIDAVTTIRRQVCGE
ncbi:MAG: phosphoglucosamine mutase, partial [Planctomycetes bacterium]|nr:phosphoglucosamine mutase [Planctomycetota bacterium]